MALRKSETRSVPTRAGRAKRGAVVAVLSVGLLSTSAPSSLVPRASAAPADPPPNVVLIVTDDQRWDTLWAMPNVQSLLGSRGVTFSNAFVVNPTCCPSRASILTGRYSHSTGVWTNDPPYGGFTAFDDSSTLATWLDDRGYRTALMGKYLNGYHEVGTRTQYIPPGWDRWWAFLSPGYFDYTVNDGGVLRTYGADPTDYSTDVMAAEAVDFITQNQQPFFLYFAPKAPHLPSTPAPRHADAFADLPPWRPASWNETKIADKPRWLRRVASLTDADAAALDGRRIDMLRTLLALDEAVGDIVTALEQNGSLADTMIVFTSDNGYAWGEHRWKRKGAPYDEVIRVPSVVRFDRVGTIGTVDPHLVLNIDLAPTIADAVGFDAPGAEGMSLLRLLRSEAPPWRHDLLVEHSASRVPSFCALRSKRYSYVRYSTGEEELYDLFRDPLQLKNQARRRRMASLVGVYRGRLAELCSSPPPGMIL